MIAFLIAVFHFDVAQESELKILVAYKYQAYTIKQAHTKIPTSDKNLIRYAK